MAHTTLLKISCTGLIEMYQIKICFDVHTYKQLLALSSLSMAQVDQSHQCLPGGNKIISHLKKVLIKPMSRLIIDFRLDFFRTIWINCHFVWSYQ